MKNLMFVFLFLFIQLFCLQSINGDDNNWSLVFNDSVYGIDLEGLKSYKTQKKIKSRKDIVVAVIDGGFDINNESLKRAFWINKKEKAGTQKDNDKNGYIDDVNGWNFIGSATGANISKVGTEEFREAKRLRYLYLNSDPSKLNETQKKEYEYYQKMMTAAGLNSYIQFSKYVQVIGNSFRVCDSLMRVCYGDKNTTYEDFKNIELSDTTGISYYLNVVYSKTFHLPDTTSWINLVKSKISESDLAEKRVKSLDEVNDEPHLNIGNNPYDFANFSYGNNDVTDTPMHGTMVAGVIAAQSGETEGICKNAKLMLIRAIPDGDEYDKDVAASIRYAVDNGAKVVNMSFGKYTSPNSKEVLNAIKYASEKDVLLVLAAGNNGRNIDEVKYYPSITDENDIRNSNMIVVGASKKDGSIWSSSNYGKKNVDVFAPGDKIKSTKENNEYFTASGTSLAAPIVSGICCELRSCFPDLSASQIRDIIIESATDMSNVTTEIPLDSKNKKAEVNKTTVDNLCVSKGIINASNAIQLAYSRSKYGKK